jgi:hypothetical protein
MMRLMQSMVPTQEPPAVQFQLSTLGLAQTIRTDGATEWKYVPPHSKGYQDPESSPERTQHQV